MGLEGLASRRSSTAHSPDTSASSQKPQSRFVEVRFVQILLGPHLRYGGMPFGQARKMVQ